MGDGYPRAELEEKVQSSNFSDRVTFTGFLERTRLLQKLNEMDLLVMPSASEPFGLVALEANGDKETVQAAHETLLDAVPQVDRWDHYSYNKLIVRLMTEDQYRQEVTENCLKEALKLTWENTVKRIEKG